MSTNLLVYYFGNHQFCSTILSTSISSLKLSFLILALKYPTLIPFWSFPFTCIILMHDAIDIAKLPWWAWWAGWPGWPSSCWGSRVAAAGGRRWTRRRSRSRGWFPWRRSSGSGSEPRCSLLMIVVTWWLVTMHSLSNSMSHLYLLRFLALWSSLSGI